MILPQYQRFGYGRFLIEFSYLLSQKEDSLGTPEKPLSDLGMISYMNYWKYCIFKVIKDKQEVSIKEISDETKMTVQDIQESMIKLKLLQKNPDYCIYLCQKEVEKELAKKKLAVNPENLRWTKYLSHYIPRDFSDEEE